MPKARTKKAADSKPLLISDEINRPKIVGHFKLLRKLGNGTFGKVKLGIHIPTGENVAVKCLNKDKIKLPCDVQRVEREIQILKIVYHPNIIQLYEIIDTSSSIYLIMEYSDGGELFDFIVKNQRLNEKNGCRFFHMIVESLEYCHNNHIIHRDLKPENMLLNYQDSLEFPVLKLIDFGLSTLSVKDELLKTSCGSPCYASPEMVAGKPYKGEISDIWSLGVVLYAIICGYLPFEDDNMSILYQKIIEGIYEIPEFLSRTCIKLLGGLLNTDPTKRYKIKDIKYSEWYNQIRSTKLSMNINGRMESHRYIDPEILSIVPHYDKNPSDVKRSVEKLEFNSNYTLYYLLAKRINRERSVTPVRYALPKLKNPGARVNLHSKVSPIHAGLSIHTPFFSSNCAATPAKFFSPQPKPQTSMQARRIVTSRQGFYETRPRNGGIPLRTQAESLHIEAKNVPSVLINPLNQKTRQRTTITTKSFNTNSRNNTIFKEFNFQIPKPQAELVRSIHRLLDKTNLIPSNPSGYCYTCQKPGLLFQIVIEPSYDILSPSNSKISFKHIDGDLTAFKNQIFKIKDLL